MKSIFKYFRVSLFFALLLAYSFYDYFNSDNSGFDDSSRGGVYIFLILIVCYSLLYLLFHFPKVSEHQGFVNTMFVLTGWILLCNVATDRLGWVMYVHLFMAIWWITAYFFFYTYCRNNPNAVDYIIGFFSAMLLLYLYFAFSSQARILSNKDMDHAVLNYAYNILAFVPIVLLLKNKTLKYLLLLISVGALFLSFKRGPLVILPTMYIAYQFGIPNSNESRGKRVFRFVLAIIGLYLLFLIVDSASGGFLSSRFTRSELQFGSTRDELWASAIEDIRRRDFITLLVGKGSGSSIELLTSGVHNEWLEFLFSFGIIGVLLYLAFGVSLLAKYKKMRKRNSELAPIVGILVSFFWMVGLFSGFYFVHTSFYFFALLGIIDALDSQAYQYRVL